MLYKIEFLNMKNKIIIIGLIITSLCYSQDFNISLGYDIKNSIKGSKPTNFEPSLNYLLRASAVDKNNIEIGIFYENFNKINYQCYGINAGYFIEILKIMELYGGVESGFIIRKFNTNRFSYGLNLEARFKIKENISISLLNQCRYRSDLHYINAPKPYRNSIFLNIIFSI